METPRLLSEYFAARAQSEGWIAANNDPDVKTNASAKETGQRMRSACWRARPRGRELSFGAALLTRCCFEETLFRRDAEINTPEAALPRTCRSRLR